METSENILEGPSPKGRLLIIGGHEDKQFSGDMLSALRKELHLPHFRVLGTLMDKIPYTHNVIEIIATASSIPEVMEEAYVAAFKSAGYQYTGVLHINDEASASDPEIVKRIHYAHAVFFTGGDQGKLTQTLNGSAVLEAIKKKYYADPNFIIAGTSAGAMAIPEVIIERGIIQESLLKDDLEVGRGFNIIDHVFIDTHFIKRGRFGRLALAVAMYQPDYIGIGLGEDGALMITGGNEAECLGSGMVILIDGSDIGVTNVKAAGAGIPVAIENLRVHILTDGCKYLLREKKFIPPANNPSIS